MREHIKYRFPTKVLIAVPLFVGALTGAMAGGAELIAATTLTPMVDPHAFGAVDILGKVVGPLMIGLGMLGLIGSVFYGKRVRPAERHEFSDEAPTKPNPLSPTNGVAIFQVTCATAIAAGIGFTVIGNIEPLAANVVTDLTITAAVFAALAVGFMILDTWTNHVPKKGVLFTDFETSRTNDHEVAIM